MVLMDRTGASRALSQEMGLFERQNVFSQRIRRHSAAWIVSAATMASGTLYATSQT